jgi:hypothetical protein
MYALNKRGFMYALNKRGIMYAKIIWINADPLKKQNSDMKEGNK